MVSPEDQEEERRKTGEKTAPPPDLEAREGQRGRDEGEANRNTARGREGLAPAAAAGCGEAAPASQGGPHGATWRTWSPSPLGRTQLTAPLLTEAPGSLMGVRAEGRGG